MEETSGAHCEAFGWRPKFLQGFATTRTFIVVFGLLGTLQAMSFVYFIATLTTLEKRFQMPSQTMGILMSGNEISQILLVLLLSYLGGKGNRPRWISWGVAISALSCYILAFPHFLYGPGETSLALTEQHFDHNVANVSIGGGEKRSPFTCDKDRGPKECSKEEGEGSFVPMLLVFMSQFVLGIGTSLYFSLGQTYMDDNTKKTRTPMLLGITMALRTLGPALGFVLGYLCLSLYIDPSLTPLIERKDPRWLGAWWLGWVILGTLMMCFAFLISMFPKNLPKRIEKDLSLVPSSAVYKETCRPLKEEEEDSLYSEYQQHNERFMEGTAFIHKEQKIIDLNPNIILPKADGFWPSIKRITTNPLLMVNNFVAIFYIIGASGYINFFNKYTETQYNSSAATANIVAAVMTIFSLVVGFLLSGFVISRWKPRTSYLLLWNIAVGLVYMAGELFIMTLGCPNDNLRTQVMADGSLNMSSECNTNCGCDSVRYSPVCNLVTHETFFSACHAGCGSMDVNSVGKRVFSNCSCLESTSDVLTQGLCPVDCESIFYVFMTTVCLMQMIGCTGRITNVLINYRSVEPQDKTIAQGLALMLISIFAFIPGPILYGKIIDNACLVWDNTCGEQGNCWLYDKKNFRIYLNATAAGFSAIAVLLDIVLWRLGRNIRLYGDDDDKSSLR